MKKFYLLLCAVSTLVFNAQAQNYHYKLTETTQAYTPLSGSVVPIVTGYYAPDWDEPVGTSIPFKGFGESVTLPRVNNYGVLYWEFSPNNDFIIRAAGSELTMVSQQGSNEVSAQIIGTSPNRIMKIEYKNMNFAHETPSLTGTWSFQIWTFEADQSIEIHYGPITMDAGHSINDIAYASILGCNSNNCSGYQYSGDPNNPTIDSTFSSQDQFTFNTIPTSGTVLRFTPYVPSPAGVKNISQQNAEISYNAAYRQLNITTAYNEKISAIRVYDITGKQLNVKANTSAGKTTVDCSSLAMGMYIVELETNDGIVAKKFVNY